jgi:hypothetical protein
MPARFAQVDENVFRGGRLMDVEIPILRDYWGINKIVSLDAGEGKEINEICKKNGVEHVIIPLTTGRDQNVAMIPDEIETWKKTGPIYVHCFHGKDRTSMVCAIYRIMKNDWTLEKALAECHKFGMGKDLDPFVANSYYEAVVSFNNHYKDVNSASDDIVSIERDNKNFVSPAISNSNVSSYNPSFSPFTDVEVDYLNRPASRLDKLIKLASTQIYKVCRLRDVLSPDKIWYLTPEEAKSNGTGYLYSATIPNSASIMNFNQQSEATLIQAAKLNEADVVFFKPTKEYYIINPAILEGIHGIDKRDNNDVVEVGQYDNYAGINTFPGGGNGFMPGAGGMVELPSWNF